MDSIWKPKGRCRVWIKILLGAVLAVCFTANAGAENERWSELKTAYFGDRNITSGDDVIALEAPSRAYDAATVPIVIKAVDSNRQIKQLHLIVDRNPVPLAGVFKVSDEAGRWESLETRIRINEYTDVRAIAELSDGTLHMTSRFVKASGGCSAPAMADMDAAMARAGKMTLLLQSSTIGGKSSTEAVIKISHPNNSGMQFDQVSRNYIPAFFVHSITAELNGKSLIEVETNFSMSENPVVLLNFTPGFDADQMPTAMMVYAEDSKGNRYEKVFEADEGALAQN